MLTEGSLAQLLTQILSLGNISPPYSQLLLTGRKNSAAYKMTDTEDGGPRASRRDVLRATVGTIGVSAVGTGGRGGYAAAETVLLDEGFEGYGTGSYPSDWTKAGNEDQRVVDSTAAEGSKALRIRGSPGGCWEALADAPVNLPNSGTVTISGSVRPTSDGEVGCHDGKRGAIGLRTETGSWDAGKQAGLLKFHTDGTVRGVDGSYGSYDIDEWNSFEVTYERTETAVTLTYRINGEDRGSGRRAVTNFEDDLSYMRFGSGDFSVFYDDLYVAEVERADAPTVETRDFTGDGTTDVKVTNSQTWLLFEGADRDGRIYTSRLGPVGSSSFGDNWDIKPTTRTDGLSHRSTERVEAFQREEGAGYHIRRSYDLGGTPFEEETTVYLPSNRRSALVRVRLTNNGNESVLLDQDRGNIHDGIMMTRGTVLNDYGSNYRFHTTGSGTHRFDNAGLWSTFELSGSTPNVTAFDDDDAISYGLVDGDSGPRHVVTNGDPVQRADFMLRETEVGAGDTAVYTLAVGAHDGGRDAPTRAVSELDAVADRTDEIPAVPGDEQPPTATLAISDGTVRVGETVTFDASQSSDPDGAIVSYAWDFDGDGTTDAIGETVTHSYDEPGQYEVVLRVTDADENTATDTGAITVEATNESPTATFSSSPDTPETGTTVTFDASQSSDPDGAITTYEWDFDGDGTTDATGEAVTHSYGESGDYTVELTVFDGDGASDTVTEIVTVATSEQAPTANLSVSSMSPTTGEAVTFDATESSDPDGSIVSYEWDFDGDGTVEETGGTVTHTFEESGTYQVRLTVIDDDGLSATASERVSVEQDNAAPTARIDYGPPNPVTGETVTFDASESSDPDGNIARYEWDFDGDGTTDATGETVTHVYEESGDYTVGLTVLDQGDERSVTTETVTVGENEAPNASFTISPDDPQTGETVTFEASGSTDSDGTISTYEWDLNGDGTIDATGETVEYTYEQGGSYTVTLTVTDDLEATGSTSRTVSIGGELADARSDKLSMADSVDSASIVTTYGWVEAGVGDRPLAEATVSSWETAVAEGRVDRTTATDAVERLTLAESATREVLEHVGPAADGDGLNFARRLASNATSVLLDLLLMKLSIGQKLLSSAPSWVAGRIKSVVGTTLEDGIVGLLGDFLSLEGARNETRKAASSEMDRVWATVTDGAADLAATMRTAIDTVVDTVTEIVRASVEFLSTNPFVSPTPPDGLADAVMGNSLWAASLDLHEQFRPAEVGSSLPGSTDTARGAKREAMQTLDTRLDTVADNLDVLSTAVDELDMYESIKDVIRADGWVDVGWQAAQAVVNVAVSLAGIVIDATATVAAGLAMWQSRKLHDEVVRSVLSGTNEVSGWTPVSK